MNDLLPNLLKLQALEFGETKEKNVAAQMAELRALIPPQVLAHYDRLVARGKKGVAIVRNQVCSGCHMQLPIGTVNTLMQGNDIRLCDSCGRYLYLPDPAENKFIEHVAASKPTPKPRKRKALTHAAA
jgi:predicted  nucleic acid-binding Zn-ribbon protein